VNRSVILAVLLVWVSSLWSQELIIDQYQDGIDVWILIPYKTFVFGKEAQTTHYQLAVEILDNGKKPVFRYDERLNIPRLPDMVESAVPINFRTQLESNRYSISVLLKNLDLGGSLTWGKNFSVDDRLTDIGSTLIVGKHQGMRFVPASWKQLRLPLQSCMVHQRMSIPTDSLAIKLNRGEEHLTVVIHNPMNVTQDILSVIRQFEPDDITVTVYETNIQYRTVPIMYSEWFSYNHTYSLKDQLQQVRYVASQNEWNTLRRLKGDNLSLAIDQFWQKHDPSPGTNRNEAREEFYRRVMYADEQYTIHKRLRGWKSDRGRVYIKFGTPDDIESDVFPVGQKPSITWHYFRLNKSFRFIDQRGYGDYRLENTDEEYSD